MTPRTIPVEVFDLIVFGATGDLAQRKLLPALFHRDLQGQIPLTARIIGSSRRTMTREAFRAIALAAIEAHVAEDLRTPDMQRFLTAWPMCGRRTRIAGGTRKSRSTRRTHTCLFMAVGPTLWAHCDHLGSISVTQNRAVWKPVQKWCPTPKPE